MKMELYYVAKVQRIFESEDKATYVLGPFSSWDRASNEKRDYQDNNHHNYDLEVVKQVIDVE